MEGADHYAVPAAVEDGHREALIPARIVKRAEPYQPNVSHEKGEVLQQVLHLALHLSRTAGDLAHFGHVLGQHGRYIAFLGIFEEGVKPSLQAAVASICDQQPDREQQHNDQEEYPKPETVVIEVLLNLASTPRL
jgi:hypothetical protein